MLIVACIQRSQTRTRSAPSSSETGTLKSECLLQKEWWQRRQWWRRLKLENFTWHLKQSALSSNACCFFEWYLLRIFSRAALFRRARLFAGKHRSNKPIEVPLDPIREVRSEPSHTRLMGEPKAKRVRHRNALLLGFSRATGEAMTAGLQFSFQLSSPSVSFPFLARCALLANLCLLASRVPSDHSSLLSCEPFIGSVRLEPTSSVVILSYHLSLDQHHT